MKLLNQRKSFKRHRLCSLAGAALLLTAMAASAQELQEGDVCAPYWLTGSIDYDWVQLTSGEWLKGELTSLYNEVLSFDSDNLEELEIDWEDVEILRSRKPMAVLLNDGREYIGDIVFNQGALFVNGTRYDVMQHEQRILSIAHINKSLLSAWEGEIGASTNIRHGNSEQTNIMLRFNLERRSVRTRFLLDAMASEGEVDAELVEKNERVDASMDWFISSRWFIRPIQVAYYSDPFQNIETRVNYTAAVGYYLIDSNRTDWDIYLGPGYQLTKYDTVQAGEDRHKETPVTALGTLFSIDISDDIEFEARYRALIMDSEFGGSSHHLDLGLSIDLLASLDLDVNYIFDYTEDPIPNQEGLVPERRDSELVVGVSLEF